MKLKTPKGELVINSASFEEAMELKRNVLRALDASGFKFSELAEMGNGNTDGIFRAAMNLVQDQGVYAAIWPCLARCTFRSERIRKDTFEDVDAREIYLLAAAKCIEENLRPFMIGLPLVWDTVEG